MTISVGSDNVLKLGRDFVDCQTGEVAAHGLVTVAGKEWKWVSMVGDPVAIDRCLYGAARREGQRVTAFRSMFCKPGVKG